MGEKEGPPMKRERRITLVLFVIYLILLTWIILFKTQFSLSALGHYRSVNLIPFGASVITNGTIDLDEIVNNLIVFIPVGLYLGMLRPNWSFGKKVLPILGLSLLYELAQFLLAIGASDITDVITNTTGGIIGVLIYLLLCKLLKDKTLRVLTLLAAVATALLLGFFLLILAANGF